MKVMLSQIVPNKFRDLTLFPIMSDKVDKLVESIDQTGFWDNLLARPLDNDVDDMDQEALVSYLSDLDAAFDDETDAPLFTVELSYGHHRLEAAKKAGLEVIDIPVKVIDDETQLRIMANENRGDWEFGNMNVILETVRQTRANIIKTAKKYDSFDEYENDGGSFFTSQKSLTQAKKIVGHKMITKFLGDTWQVNDVRAAVEVLASVDDGIYEQDSIVAISSIAMLKRYNDLAKAIHAKEEWPEFFKVKYIKDCRDYILDKDTRASSKVVELAKNAVEKNNNPLTYLKTQKRQEFNLVNEVAELIQPPDVDKKKPVREPAKVAEMIGDFEGKDEVMEEAIAVVEKARQKQKPAGGKPDEEAAPEDTGEGEGEPEGQKSIEDALAGVQDEEKAKIDEGLKEAEVDDTGKAAIGAVSDMFIHSATNFAIQAEMVMERISEIDDTDVRFHTAAEEAFKSVCRIMLDQYGMNDVQRLVESVEKAELTDKKE